MYNISVTQSNGQEAWGKVEVEYELHKDSVANLYLLYNLVNSLKLLQKCLVYNLLSITLLKTYLK